MKTIILLIANLLCFYSFSQNKIEVKETSQNIGGAINNALTVCIYEADEKLIEKEWKILMKNYNAKISSKKEIFADNALIGSISPDTVDVYATVESGNDCRQLTVGFNVNKTFLSSKEKPDEYQAAEKIIYDFAVDVTKKAIGEQFTQAQKDLTALENQLNMLIKTNERLATSIENYKLKISEAEANIQTNNEKQAEVQKQIEAQKEVVKSIQEKEKNVK